MHRRFTFGAASLVAVAALVLTGCSDSDSGGKVSNNGAAPAPTSNAKPAKGKSDNGDSDDSSDANLVKAPFGGSYKGSDLSVALSKPSPYTASDSAFVQGNSGRAVVFNVTITNNSKQSFPAMGLQTDAQAGGQTCEQIEDSENNVGSSMANVLPGKTLTWKAAFAVPKNAKDMDVQVSSMGGGKTIVFSGKL